MLVYRKTITGTIDQEFNESGSVVYQYFQETPPPKYDSIDTETGEVKKLDWDDLPFRLELEPELVEPVIFENIGDDIYSICLEVEVWQLFGDKGRAVCQDLKCSLGFRYGSATRWKGGRKRSKRFETDQDLLFYQQLPFEFALHAEFVQPKYLSAAEKLLAKQFL